MDSYTKCQGKEQHNMTRGRQCILGTREILSVELAKAEIWKLGRSYPATPENSVQQGEEEGF